MRRPRANAATIACCLTALALPAAAQTNPDPAAPPAQAIPTTPPAPGIAPTPGETVAPDRGMTPGETAAPAQGTTPAPGITAAPPADGTPPSLVRGVTPPPAAVADAAPPALVPPRLAPPVATPIWLDGNGQPVAIIGNMYGSPERSAAGKPFSPMMPGSRAGDVAGMNARPAARPMPTGTRADTAYRMEGWQGPPTPVVASIPAAQPTAGATITPAPANSTAPR